MGVYCKTLSRYHAYLNKAVSLLEAYPGESPFSLYLKEQFSNDRRMGSTDRKLVRQYCYCYFRMGKSLPNWSIADKLLAGLWLCSSVAEPLLAAVRPEWNDKVGLPLQDKVAMLRDHISWNQLFPYSDHLTKGLVGESWAASLFTQPETFIRVRPGQEEKINNRLQSLAIAHTNHSTTCISFPASINLVSIGELNKEFVVQDYSSQRIAELMQLLPTKKELTLWDCCAASGGKSILAYDKLEKFSLIVSDVRHSMLAQLKKRFAEAGLHHYQSLQVDLEKEIPRSLVGAIDLLIADVPCSGSGTWGRTPEQLQLFAPDQIFGYAKKQQRILNNAIRSLRSGGYLLYITCSIFKEENEDQLAWLCQEKGMRLLQSSLYVGTEKKADTLYAALLQLP